MIEGFKDAWLLIVGRFDGMINSEWTELPRTQFNDGGTNRPLYGFRARKSEDISDTDLTVSSDSHIWPLLLPPPLSGVSSTAAAKTQLFMHRSKIFGLSWRRRNKSDINLGRQRREPRIPKVRCMVIR